MTRPIVWALGVLATAAVSATIATDRLAGHTRPQARAPERPIETVAPRRDVATQVSSPQSGSRTETIKGDQHGHFSAEGRIDGTRISFMVDTGASLVALREEDAERVGIHVRRSDFTGRTSTANGAGSYAPVRIKSLRIGDIELRDVDAAIIARGQLGANLLGMSFLKRLRGFDIANNRITLRS